MDTKYILMYPCNCGVAENLRLSLKLEEFVDRDTPSSFRITLLNQTKPTLVLDLESVGTFLHYWVDSLVLLAMMRVRTSCFGISLAVYQPQGAALSLKIPLQYPREQDQNFRFLHIMVFK